jgi:predicted CxxxxCH...CXXCH cytochrome family protein
MTDGANASAGEPTVTMTDMDFGTPTCSPSVAYALGCHATGSPDWGVATTADECVECHTNTTQTEVNPTTGLHNLATVGLTDHDSGITGGSGAHSSGCEACHTSSPRVTATDHQDGSLETVSNTNYSWYTTNIAAGYDESGDGCAASCHDDGGSWNREWSGVEDVSWTYTDDAASAAVCGNCHGSFGMGWNLTASDTNHGNPYGTNDPNRLDNSPARGQHTECTSCHGWDDSGGNYEGATKHTNDSITMNSDLSYNDADGSCGSNCHGGYTDITMTPLSEWPNDTVAAGAVSCGSCHGDPASVGGVDRTTESATHAAHGATSGELVAENEAVCEQCHPTVDYQSGHSGALSLDPAKVTYSGGDNGTCTTSSCHNQAADESNMWDSATQLECNDCHGDASGGLSSSHTKHFSKGYDCDSCHSKPGAGNTLHANDGTTLADRSVADQDEAEVTEGTWDDGTDACSNTACHNPSGASYAATWQVTTAGCTTCHSDSDPATGDHTKHIDASTLFGIDTVSCTSCHPDNTLTSHTTGAVLFSGVSYAGCDDGLRYEHLSQRWC